MGGLTENKKRMGEEEKKPNLICLNADVLEEIFLRLPLRSILKFKTVSKQWRSILESRSFTERRMKIQKRPKILAAGDHRTKSRLEGDEEMDMVYLHCDEATRPSLTCDGLVCIPVPGSVIVLNPTTGESLRFPSGPDPVTHRYDHLFFRGFWWNIFPGFYAMGFGKDKVNGSYKVVRMFFDPDLYCEILDVNIGEWRKIRTPPPYVVDMRRKSMCVNGSIYWLELVRNFSILALDLHTEEFRHFPTPEICHLSDQVMNFEDRLALATTYSRFGWKLEIRCIDAQEKIWSLTHSINLVNVARPRSWELWLRPVAVSKQGNLFFHDNKKRLFKYYPETEMVRCLSVDINVISPFVENLAPLRCPSSTSEYRSGFHYLEHAPSSRIPKNFRRIKSQIPSILVTTTTLASLSLVLFRYFVVSSKS